MTLNRHKTDKKIMYIYLEEIFCRVDITVLVRLIYKIVLFDSKMLVIEKKNVAEPIWQNSLFI